MHRCNHRPSLIMGSIMAIMGAALCATMSIGHIGFIRTAAAHEAAEGLPLGDRKISDVPMGMIGVTKDGVALFNAFDAEGFDAPAHEIQDKCNGHPQFSGQYHYHNWSPCIKAERADAPVGWMLDGFPILGPTGVDGKKITNADLDECHGRVGPVWMDGKLVTLYHYHFTLEYPYTIGCYRGHVDQAFLHVLMGKAGSIFQFLLPGGPPPPQQQPPQQPPPPR